MSGLTRLALNLKVIVFARLGEFSTVTWARFLYSLLFFPLGSEDGSASLSSLWLWDFRPSVSSVSQTGDFSVCLPARRPGVPSELLWSPLGALLFQCQF